MASPSRNSPRLRHSSASPRPATAQLYPSTVSSQADQGSSTAQPIHHDRQAHNLAPQHRQHQHLQTSPEHLSLSSGSSAQGLPAAPVSFTPFFTLIADSATGEHHHPAVHYLFADDDPDMLTDALLRRLDPDVSSSADQLPAAAVERHLLIDIGLDGRSVVSAQSLAPDWQILDAHVSAAPTFHGDADAAAEVDDEAGLLLRVDGVGLTAEGDSHSLPPSRGGVEHGEGVAGMLATVERLRREVQVLRRLAGLHGEIPPEAEEVDPVPVQGSQRKVEESKDADG